MKCQLYVQYILMWGIKKYLGNPLDMTTQNMSIMVTYSFLFLY